MRLTTKQLSLIVGLYAKWGSGKSFLLRRLRRELEAFTRGCWALGPFSLAGGNGLPYRKVSTLLVGGGVGRPSFEDAGLWDGLPNGRFQLREC
jgi:hypothetical protein